tara:strand:- start:1768 stop:2109 length:342 start_codon:yes stop_codon:yes gene_type:complete
MGGNLAKVERPGNSLGIPQKEFIDNLRAKYAKLEGTKAAHVIPEPERPKVNETQEDKQAATDLRKELRKKEYDMPEEPKDEELAFMEHVIGKMRLGKQLTVEEDSTIRKILEM